MLPPSTPIHLGNHSYDPTLWLVGPSVFEMKDRAVRRRGDRLDRRAAYVVVAFVLEAEGRIFVVQ